MSEENQVVEGVRAFRLDPNSGETSQMSLYECGREIFRITPEGRLMADGEDITDDLKRIAEVFWIWVKASGVHLPEQERRDE